MGKDITRRINGKVYRLVYHTRKKTTSKKYAQHLRRQGYNARVIKAEYTLGLPWSVFVRKR